MIVRTYVVGAAVSLCALLTGCASPTSAPTTDGWVTVSSAHGVDVQLLPRLTETSMGELHQYYVRYSNRSDNDKCVSVSWRLVDLRNVTIADPVVVISHKAAYVGALTHEVWDFDGLAIAVPPSGQVRQITVTDPINKLATNQHPCVAFSYQHQ